MALMSDNGRYPITSFADLQAAVNLAQFDPEAARAVRDFLMLAHFQQQARDSVIGDPNKVALEVLRKAQRIAAQHGSYFTLEWGGVIYNPPTVTTNNLNLPAVLPPKPPAPPPKPPAPRAPAGVNFTSHQRVGDEIRDGYIEHVHDMFARGFIDTDEHDARLKALMLAHTKEEMEFLIQDLPKVPDRTGGQAEPQKRGVLLYPVLAATSGMGALGLLVEAPAHLVIFSLVIFIVLVVVSAVFTVLGLASFVRRGK